MLLMVQSHPQCRRPGLDPPLEEVVATHSSILVGKIPWTEEPGGLPSMGSQRVGQTERLSTLKATKLDVACKYFHSC